MFKLFRGLLIGAVRVVKSGEDFWDFCFRKQNPGIEMSLKLIRKKAPKTWCIHRIHIFTWFFKAQESEDTLNGLFNLNIKYVSLSTLLQHIVECLVGLFYMSTFPLLLLNFACLWQSMDCVSSLFTKDFAWDDLCNSFDFFDLLLLFNHFCLEISNAYLNYKSIKPYFTTLCIRLI